VLIRVLFRRGAEAWLRRAMPACAGFKDHHLGLQERRPK
jgi:hypothetical protein